MSLGVNIMKWLADDKNLKRSITEISNYKNFYYNGQIPRNEKLLNQSVKIVIALQLI